MTVDDTLGILQPRQQVALLALLRTGSVPESASAAGVSERTLRRWLQTAPFTEAMRQAGRDTAREATSCLLAAQLAAVQALRLALGSESSATTVRAARALLELGLRAQDDDSHQRLDDLERRIARWEDTSNLRSV